LGVPYGLWLTKSPYDVAPGEACHENTGVVVETCCPGTDGVPGATNAGAEGPSADPVPDSVIAVEGLAFVESLGILSVAENDAAWSGVNLRVSWTGVLGCTVTGYAVGLTRANTPDPPVIVGAEVI